MGGPVQHSNIASVASLYDRVAGGSMRNAGPASDEGDAVMARLLQSAGLQHLASPLASTGIDHRHLPNLLAQGFGAHSSEEKQRIFKIMRSISFNGDLGSQQNPAPAQSSAMEGLRSPDFRGDFGAGLLDLHAIDDMELLSEHVMSEPFEPSPYMAGRGFENEFNMVIGRSQREQNDGDYLVSLPANEKENAKENNMAKIKVVVRKRPLNKKETARKEDDIVTVLGTTLTVHEPKLKVDLTAYVEKHEFCFDAVLDEHVTNDEVYQVTVEPIVPTIFQRTKATCFAYGQTGSGKTFTMQPLPLRAAEDLVKILNQPIYHSQRFKLWLSYFEIYGGKLYDLLSDRKKLCMREDGRQQVCIVGLQEFEVSDVQIVKGYIERGNAARSTGSTGANEESSRSHAILQLAIKKHGEAKDSRRNNDGLETKVSKLVGKISFIDLAGSERGADTTDNDRQTRIEGAEINKSLLALKECIRALDNDQIHIPFRGSKLTEVLRDSFVGNSRTVMISCISPNAGSCEHTLNTLRYADRVKSLSKSANPKKDATVISLPPQLSKDPLPPPPPPPPSSSSLPASADTQDAACEQREASSIQIGPAVEDSRQAPSIQLNRPVESGLPASYWDRDKFDGTASFLYNQKGGLLQYSKVSADMQDSQESSPPRRRGCKEERSQNLGSLLKKPDTESDPTAESSSKQQNTTNYNGNADGLSKMLHYEPESTSDKNIAAILEEEDALIAAHRKEIEDTMDIIREEMKLLSEVDQPGSMIDNYVAQLSSVLSRKAAGLVSLQARLARFQNRLKEQEVLSRKRVPPR